VTGSAVTEEPVPLPDAGGRRSLPGRLEAAPPSTRRRRRSGRAPAGTGVTTRQRRRQRLAGGRRYSNRTVAERRVVETLLGSVELEVVRMGMKWQRVLR